MCLSRLGQILYGVAMFVALALTLAGALTPGWRQLEIQMNTTTTMSPTDPSGIVSHIKQTVNSGLFSFACTAPGEKSDARTDADVKEYCANWWKNQPLWEKIVIGLIAATVIGEAVALVYNFITFCCCCCRGHALKPLAPLALICFIMLGVAVAVYAIKNRDALEQNKSVSDLNDPKNTVGYSFFLECGALGLLLINVVIGSMAACLGDKCL